MSVKVFTVPETVYTNLTKDELKSGTLYTL